MEQDDDKEKPIPATLITLESKVGGGVMSSQHPAHDTQVNQDSLRNSNHYYTLTIIRCSSTWTVGRVGTAD